MAVIIRTLYLLDTNMVSYIANGSYPAAQHTLDRLIKNHPIATSAIVEGEIRYGVARKPPATRLRASVEALLSILRILPWDSAALAPMALSERNSPASASRLRRWTCSSPPMLSPSTRSL